MARRIEVEIVGDSRSLERAFARSERSAKKFQGTIATTSSKVRSSLGSFGVGGPATATAGGFLLGRQFVDAARNAEVILGQTSIAVKDAGLQWNAYSKQVQAASQRISTSSAFDDEAVLQSFQVFVRGQKDVQQSLKLTELAADVARGRYTDLDTATQLVNKAAMGQIGALRRAGIQIDENATSAEALDALLRAYGGSAEKYADSAVGSSEKLRVAWENLAEQAGGPLSGALAQVAGELTTIVGLMQTAGQLKFPGFAGGGSLGGLASKAGGVLLMPGLAPVIVSKAIADKLGGLGGANLNIPTGATGGTGPTRELTPNAAAARARAEAIRIGVFRPSDAVGVVGDIASFINRWTAVGKANSVISGIASFVNKWVAVGKKAADAQKAQEAYQTRMETRRGWLDFGIERAESTKKLSDDRAAYKALERYLQERIRHEGRTLELVRDLWRARQAIRDLNKKQADKDPLAGFAQASTKQLTNMLAAGTGLTGAARGRLAYNIAGGEPVVVHNHVYIDGREVGHAVTREQTRTSRRTARQTSGARG